MAFQVGMLVECVDDRPDLEGRPPNVNVGRIYTIAGLHGLGVSVFGEGYGVLLVEAEPNSGDSYFAAERFRPLTDSRLAIFRSLLTPLPKREAADA